MWRPPSGGLPACGHPAKAGLQINRTRAGTSTRFMRRPSIAFPLRCPRRSASWDKRMFKTLSALSVSSAALICLCSSSVSAQITRADYDRAQAQREQYESLAVNVPDTPTWIGATHRFYYRRSRSDGFEFVTVDADTRQKQPSFDHT